MLPKFWVLKILCKLTNSLISHCPCVMKEGRRMSYSKMEGFFFSQKIRICFASRYLQNLCNFNVINDGKFLNLIIFLKTRKWCKHSDFLSIKKCCFGYYFLWRLTLIFSINSNLQSVYYGLPIFFIYSIFLKCIFLLSNF